MKITSALLKYYEHDNRNELIRFTLHAYSQPTKSENLRKSLVLEDSEREEIGKKGMLEIKNELDIYFDTFKTGGKFCIANALYANGLCCKNCMAVCHGIKYWEPLTDEQKSKFIGKVMKWIQSKTEQEE